MLATGRAAAPMPICKACWQQRLCGGEGAESLRRTCPEKRTHTSCGTRDRGRTCARLGSKRCANSGGCAAHTLAPRSGHTFPLFGEHAMSFPSFAKWQYLFLRLLLLLRLHLRLHLRLRLLRRRRLRHLRLPLLRLQLGACSSASPSLPAASFSGPARAVAEGGLSSFPLATSHSYKTLGCPQWISMGEGQRFFFGWLS